MIKNITLGQYLPGSSIIHRADPRTKIIITVLFMVVLFIVSSIWALLAAFACVAGVFLISGISFKYAIRGMKPVLFIIVFTMILNMFFTDGTVLIRLGPVRITEEGLILAAVVSMRVFLLIASASIMTYTTTPITLTDGIEKLMNPLKKVKFPVHEMAMMMTIALRFIPTLIDETDKIMKAQAARGADIGSGNLLQRAKSFIPVLIPLFVSSFRRADELAIAMEARCYRGSEGRTSMRVLKFNRNDVAIFSFFCIICAGILLIHYLI
ncbi:MAG TPA: energy-coupling factor transporter transmembrane component T [Clostridia bacterium]|nr:energy-coupling factor transporter transmembrane component T [Clostridia bacterium]HPQ47619.1 energy-coupling factor transporter transmembrane component T [Clostridia bacterium]